MAKDENIKFTDMVAKLNLSSDEQVAEAFKDTRGVAAYLKDHDDRIKILESKILDGFWQNAREWLIKPVIRVVVGAILIAFLLWLGSRMGSLIEQISSTEQRVGIESSLSDGPTK